MANKENIKFRCFNCLHNTVGFVATYDFEEYGYLGEGIVTLLTCSNCGAEVEYRVSNGKEEE